MFEGLRNRAGGLYHIPKASEGGLAEFGFSPLGLDRMNARPARLHMQERGDCEHCIPETGWARFALFALIISLNRVHDLFDKHQFMLLAVFAIFCPAWAAFFFNHRADSILSTVKREYKERQPCLCDSTSVSLPPAGGLGVSSCQRVCDVCHKL
jgi:hypothetical protein